MRLDADPPTRRGEQAWGIACGALSAVGGAATLWIGPPPWPVALCAAGAIVGGVALLARALRRHASTSWLEVDADGIVLARGERRERVRWAELRAIEVDEERLTVRLWLHGGGCLPLEPCYASLGAYDLARVLERARGRLEASDGGANEATSRGR
ncbi:MAG: hypothetical protein NZ898_03495 [Myxococcota bacterium]|nr:hypothetical protein [Myxococcota bacterium]MDW8361172.1 hypothetical protein [Myxococcales bacterium]